MEKERLIFHVDVNNAFLSWTAVELLRKGKRLDIRKIPSIIGGDEAARRGIVLAKSPVAKKFGIKTAETIYAARKKCKNLQVFPPDHDLYKKRSDELFQYLSQYTPKIERYSIDECFLDMTGMSLLYPDPLALAYKIKDEIKEKFGYTVNVGLGNNKLCAKMASDFEKPDRVHTLFIDEIQTKLWPLKVEDLLMIGKQSAATLRQLKIYTVEDLAHADMYLLTKYFKSQAKFMKDSAWGIDDSPLETDRHALAKCVSTSRTLPYDYRDARQLKKVLLQESEEVARVLRRQHQYAKTVAVTFKNSQFVSYSHQMKLYNETNVTADIYKAAAELFDRAWKEDDIRNIGIRLSDLVLVKEQQISLFDKEKDHGSDKIQEVLDQIQDKYGVSSIFSASSLESTNKNTES